MRTYGSVPFLTRSRTASAWCPAPAMIVSWYSHERTSRTTSATVGWELRSIDSLLPAQSWNSSQTTTGLRWVFEGLDDLRRHGLRQGQQRGHRRGEAQESAAADPAVRERAHQPGLGVWRTRWLRGARIIGDGAHLEPAGIAHRASLLQALAVGAIPRGRVRTPSPAALFGLGDGSNIARDRWSSDWRSVRTAVTRPQGRWAAAGGPKVPRPRARAERNDGRDSRGRGRWPAPGRGRTARRDGPAAAE